MPENKQMKSPVNILFQDIGQPRRDADNLIQLTVQSTDTKLPYIKIQVQRHELAKLLTSKYVGHLQGHKIDGFIVT